jgi:hypothetical protein
VIAEPEDELTAFKGQLGVKKKQEEQVEVMTEWAHSRIGY